MYNEPTYEQELKNPLSYEDCVRVVDDIDVTLKKWHMQGSIYFTGGDPLLRHDFFDILSYANNKGFLLGILGNPNHITLAIAKKLKSLGIRHYQVSIDGMEETHDFFRKKGSFKKTLNALRILKKAGIETGVMFTLSRQNAEELIKVVNLVVGKEVDNFAFGRVSLFGNAKSMKDQMLTPAEYRKLLLEVFKEFLKLKNSGCKTNFMMKDNLWKLFYQELGLFDPILYTKNDKKTIYEGCSTGISALVILANGVVYACRRFPSPVGKVPEQKIEEIFLCPKMDVYREVDNFKKCSRCDLFQFCRGCPAVAFSVSGDYFSADPQCWKNILGGLDESVHDF
jgi:radical SAM/SPASM domain protein of ACGX system